MSSTQNSKGSSKPSLSLAPSLRHSKINMSSSAGWKRAPKPKNIEQFNKHPYNSSLANGPASSQSGPSSKLPASRGLMARGLNPVLGFMVIGTLAWCSFQMLTESRAGKEKERGIASVQNPMRELTSSSFLRSDRSSRLTLVSL